MNDINSNKTYFWANDGDDLAGELLERVKAFNNYITTTGIKKSWDCNRRFYENVYFSELKSEDVVDTGENGEIKATAFNHFRNILRHIYNQTTADTPEYQVTTANTNLVSRRAASIGNELVDYYAKVMDVVGFINESTETAIVEGDGFLLCEWNPTIGQEKESITGNKYRLGEFEIESLLPEQVIYDYTKKSWKKVNWAIAKQRKNKFDIAAMFPAKAQEIINLGDHKDDIEINETFDPESVETDDIFIYSAYHKATPSMPKGKYILFCGNNENGIALYEGDNPYRENLPIFKISPAKYLKKAFGITEASIIRSPQMLINMAVSAMITNLSQGGVNNIWTPPNSGLQLEEVQSGLNHIESEVKPEIMDFFKNNPQLGEAYSMAVSACETLSGQNSVVRGNIENTQLKSGVALSTVINMAQQYGQGLQRAYYKCFEEVFTFILKTLQLVATEERLYEVVGKAKSGYVKTFVNKDLEGVTRVMVKQVNSIIKQPGAQYDLAMEFLKIGTVTPYQVMDVINTGNLKPVTEANDRMMDFIVSIKEQLLDGKAIPGGIPGINHQILIKEVLPLTWDLELINDPANKEKLQNIYNFLNAQMELVRSGDELANFCFANTPPAPKQLPLEALEQFNQPQEQQGLPPQPMQGM